MEKNYPLGKKKGLEMTKIIEILKQLQADSHAMYVKVHNYHWNVEGMDFFPVHNQTEEIYTNFSTLYDDVAERILQLGDKPYLTLSDLVNSTKIEEETSSSFKSREIVEKIIKDYNYFLTSFRSLSEIAGESGDKTTESFADENVAKLEKDLWMIGNMLK